MPGRICVFSIVLGGEWLYILLDALVQLMMSWLANKMVKYEGGLYCTYTFGVNGHIE